MGKKKITTQTTEEALKDTEKQEIAAKSATSKTVVKKFERGRVYINASYNNTVITITDAKGNVVAWSSAGALGFAGPKKATPFAASKVVAVLAEKVQKFKKYSLMVDIYNSIQNTFILF